MKKILFMFVAVAGLVVPAWAVVNITATTTQVTVGGDVVDTDEIVISYEVSGEPNLVRAFAFDITVQDPCGDPAADAHILDINEAELNVDYWVYPGSIDINSAGAVNDVGTPVADPCQLPSDTKGGLGTNAITIEMGSLYVGEANAPATSGVLLKLYVDDNCLLKMADNISRGAVVMEGVGSKVTTNYTGTSNNMYNGTDIAQWRLVGRPKCWCRYKGGRQCRGDVDGLTEPFGKGFVPIGLVDYGLMTDTSTWSKPVGTPGVNICADIDHAQEPFGKGFVRVGLVDYSVMTSTDNWSKPSVPADCPPGSP